MAIQSNRFLLLSSSALVLLTLAGATLAQTPPPPDEPQTPQQAPQTPPPASQPPAPSETPPQETPAAPAPSGEAAPAVPPGAVQLPPVTVTAPPQRPAPPAAPRPVAPPPQPAAAPATTPQQTQAGEASRFNTEVNNFNNARSNIYAPLGTAPSNLSHQDIESLPQGTNAQLNEVLLQLPGVTKDSAASGNFHVRNEHANVQFRINGVMLPDGLSGFGQILDASLIGNLALITGALPAQYGLRTAALVDISTRSGAFDNTGAVSVYGGSRETRRTAIEYGGRTGSTEYFFTGSYLQNILGIENPTPNLNAVHDFTQQARGFGYISTIIDPTTRLTLVTGTSTNKFQIPDRPGLLPSFTAFGMNFFDSAQLNENQIERNHFAVLALQKSLADFDAQLSYFTRYASVHFFPDPVGDLMFNGTATDVFRGSLVNGIQADTAWRMTDTHTIRSGLYVSGEKSLVQTNYQLLPIDATTGAQILPDIPFGVTDSSSLLGWLTGVYMSDEWKITDKLTFVSGLRFDQMNQYTNANQFSPRASVIYKATPSTTFHAGYARYFTPPVQVIAAPSNVALISSCPPSIPNCTTVQAPATPGPYGPVLPERSHVFDIGVLQDVFPGFKVGADAYFKYARDLLDDGQFGAAYVLNGFNYDRAQNIGELKGVYTNGNFKAYANWAWARQKATNIVSNQYLFSAADLDYIANHWIYTDHAQVWTGSAGVSYLWWGTRFTADMIYGSGLRAGDFNTDHVAPYAQVNMGLSHEFLIPGWRPVTARFDVVNVFDTIYSIRNGSGIGVFAPQFGPRRGYYFGLSQKFGPGPETPATPPPVYPLPVFAGIPVDKGLMSAKAPVAPLWSWAGFYLGANIGCSPAKPNTDAVFSDPTGATLFTDSASSRFRGVNGGVQAGYNSQWGSWLAGVEADVQGNSERAKVEFACPGAICNPAGIGTPVSVEHYRKLDRFATLRGRVGAMLTPDAVVYATGGAAVAGISNYGWINPDVDPAGNPIVDSNSTNILGRTMKWGFAVGGGVEARLLGNLTGKIEYFHLDFGTVSFAGFNPIIAPPVAVSLNSRLTDDIVRVGVNYNFGPYWGIPVQTPVYQTPVVSKAPFFTKAPIALAWTWSGYYLGANIGYSWGRSRTEARFSDNTGAELFATSGSSNINGAIFGTQTGYNWQVASWLAGIEGDIQISSQRAKPTFACPGFTCNPAGPVVASFDQSLKMEWFATLRARLGATVTPDILVYVTGGLAGAGFMPAGTVASFDSTVPVAIVTPFDTLKLKIGWAAGVGVEGHLGGPWTGKVEYLHLDFGTFASTAINDLAVPMAIVDFNYRITDNIVRVGLNYKFDGTDVLFAKY